MIAAASGRRHRGSCIWMQGALTAAFACPVPWLAPSERTLDSGR
jgi:hypothetical protein